jgi:hypothetical protein
VYAVTHAASSSILHHQAKMLTRFIGRLHVIREKAATGTSKLAWSERPCEKENAKHSVAVPTDDLFISSSRFDIEPINQACAVCS